MEVRSSHERGASSSHGSGKASASGKGKKNRSASVLVSEPRSAWTGQKKTKIESPPTSEEIAHGQEEIEGLDWDNDKLRKEINCYLGRLHDGPSASYDCDDEGLWAMYNEEELTALNRRLALCRIRAHEEKYRGLDDTALSDLFPPSVLEENGYFKHYEDRFEWYFDPGYCEYARFQDYQRLMLRDNGEFEEYEYYRYTCSTLEGDQQFVHFWEKLSSKTKLIELYQTDMSSDTRIVSLFVYHALKIAAGLPHVYKTLIISGYNDFISMIEMECTLHKFYADFLFELLEQVANQKMNSKDALMHIYDKGNSPSVFLPNTDFE
ncbi:hypothetical protein BS78_01G040800 [Paspalum vaginatum]|nr:hypothetical protein BS78_01G040800 [Paspalum vaginatum]